MLKHLYIFKAQLCSHGLKLKSRCILESSPVQAVATAQKLMGVCDAATILVERKPETFFECHG